jgi:hypothetical protein
MSNMNSKLPDEDNAMNARCISVNEASTSSVSDKRSLKRDMKVLPEDFVPMSYSVMCGRGKGNYNAIGNRRLRVIVGSFLQQYIDAQHDPHQRTRIVEQVIGIVKEACPVGGFIKCENGRFYELSARAAREKCGALFRDCMQANSRERQAQEQVKQQHLRQDQLLPQPIQRARKAPPKQAQSHNALYWEPLPLAAAGGEPMDAPSMPSFHALTRATEIETLSRAESFGSSGSSDMSFYDVHTKRSTLLNDPQGVYEPKVSTSPTNASIRNDRSCMDRLFLTRF